MPANRFNGLTDYGIGIGLRAPHYRHILSRKPVVDWFEIISENFMIDGGRPLHILDQILEQYKVVQHGVSMYFGSAEKPNREHLRRLKQLVKRTKTPWLSDHLCWGSVDGRYTHDLLPMPYTFEAARVTAQKVREVRDFLEGPIAVENVSSYAEFHISEMNEWEFLNEVVERADCGILLDVNNIYVSSQNHNFDPFTYVNSVPPERVAQIHIAGHSKFEKYILDTHDHPVLDPVWNLYERAIQRAGHTATLLEWDDSIPSFEEVHREALKANRFLADTGSGGRGMKLAVLQRAVARAVMQPLTPSERMSRTAPGGGRMSAYAARYIKPNDRLTSCERLEIYNRQYWFRVLGSMAEDFPGLRAILGARRFEDMCRAYLVDCPSRSFTLRNLGAGLETWLRQNGKWVGGKRPLALDMVRLEWADIEAFDSAAEPTVHPEDLNGVSVPTLRLHLQPYLQLLHLRYPVDELLLRIRGEDEGVDFASNAVTEMRKNVKVRAATALRQHQIFLVVHQMDCSVYYRRVEPEAYALLSALRSGKTIDRSLELAFLRSSIPEFDRGVYTRNCFRTWATLGWFCRPTEKRAR